MTHIKIPQTDSIHELAHFWDTHDVTDFSNEMEEVTDAVFERQTVVTVHLGQKDAAVVADLAKSRGATTNSLIHEWVVERIQSLSK